MYEDLIKRLRDDEAWKNCDFDFIYGWMHEAADAIEALSKTEKTTHWIPVTERLPEKDTRVIVCASLPEGIHSDFIYEDGHWFVSIGVTHWMPLPEPPKEDE